MIDEVLAAARSAGGAALDELKKSFWQSWAQGVYTDSEAEQFQSILESKVQARQEKRERKRSIFPPRPKPVSFDRKKSLLRRRKTVSFSWLPSDIAKLFSEAERSALCIIAETVYKKGYCDTTIGRLAAAAGVSRRTVQNAQRKAISLGLIAVEERRQRFLPNLSNIVRIVDNMWRTWLQKRRGLRGEGANACAPLRSIDSYKDIDLQKEALPSVDKPLIAMLYPWIHGVLPRIL